jgi:peptidoglycan hydrolase CwlO-like protein
MKKKILLGIVAIVAVIVGYNTVSGWVSGLNNDTGETPPITQTPITTSTPSILETIQNDIDALQKDMVTSKSNDDIMRAKLDQLIQMVQTLKAEIEAQSQK